jgi:hypothetical protein
MKQDSNNLNEEIEKIKEILRQNEENFIKRIKSYLYDEVKMPTQFEIKNNINMCCGIGYLVIKFKNHLISNYQENNIEKYRKIFTLLMKIASDRKLENPQINLEGEFINEKTIQKDFPEIYENMNYYELIIGGFCEDNDKNIKQIEESIDNLSVYEPIIMCCDANVFVIFKLTDEELLIIDSHIPFHGKIKKNKFIDYLTFEKDFNGIISLGCYKKT